MKRISVVLTGIFILALAVLLSGCLNRSNIAPVAQFFCETANPCVGLPIRFDASASSDIDGEIVSYEWNFGDGITGEGEQPEHWYQIDGPFTVQLTVMDSDGATDTCDLDVEIAPITGELAVSLQNLDKTGEDNSTCQLFQITIENGIAPFTADWGDGNEEEIDVVGEHRYFLPSPVLGYHLIVRDALGITIYTRAVHIVASCFEIPEVSANVPRFVSQGDSIPVKAKDRDEPYTFCNPDFEDRPSCQTCAVDQTVVDRSKANMNGICLIRAIFREADTGDVVHTADLDLGNPVLIIPNLSPGSYEVELIALDNDPDCARQNARTIYEFRVQ